MLAHAAAGRDQHNVQDIGQTLRARHVSATLAAQIDCAPAAFGVKDGHLNQRAVCQPRTSPDPQYRPSVRTLRSDSTNLIVGPARFR
jgi:hypothetical protein